MRHYNVINRIGFYVPYWSIYCLLVWCIRIIGGGGGGGGGGGDYIRRGYRDEPCNHVIYNLVQPCYNLVQPCYTTLYKLATVSNTTLLPCYSLVTTLYYKVAASL